MFPLISDRYGSICLQNYETTLKSLWNDTSKLYKLEYFIAFGLKNIGKIMALFRHEHLQYVYSMHNWRNGLCCNVCIFNSIPFVPWIILTKNLCGKKAISMVVGSDPGHETD